MSAQFQIFKDSANEYRFRLRADNHEIILQSEGYSEKARAQDGIASVRTNAPLDARYDRKGSAAGNYYFNLTAGNNQVIGTSETYETTANRERGIEAVKKHGATAPIVDEA